jgi:hypothetical protein
LLPGLGYKIPDIPIEIARRSARTMFPSPQENVLSKFALQFQLVGRLISGFVVRRGTFNLGTLERNRICCGLFL